MRVRAAADMDAEPVARQPPGSASLIKPVADRPGHDRRYSLDTSKLRSLGWRPRRAFEQGLAETVAWYQQNARWWRPIKDQDPEFRKYYHAQYGNRS